MAFYQEMLSTVKELLKEFGTRVKVQAADGTERATVMAVFVAPDDQWMPNQTGVGGTIMSTVQAEKVALVQGDIKFEPTLGDVLLQGTKVWRITGSELIKPGPTALLWKLEVTS